MQGKGYFCAKFASKLPITLQMVHYCCFSLGRKQDFLQKKFYNIHKQGTNFTPSLIKSSHPYWISNTISLSLSHTHTHTLSHIFLLHVFSFVFTTELLFQTSEAAAAGGWRRRVSKFGNFHFSREKSLFQNSAKIQTFKTICVLLLQIFCSDMSEFYSSALSMQSHKLQSRRCRCRCRVNNPRPYFSIVLE